MRGQWQHLLPGFAVLGVGAGLSFPSLAILAMSAATSADSGTASGLVNTTAQVGGALGLAIMATVGASRATHLLGEGLSPAASLTGGYHLVLATGAGVVLVATLLAALVLRRVPAAPVVAARTPPTEEEQAA